jgi:hypothetical protein
MKIDLLIVNFFTERKKVIRFNSLEERLESELDEIGKAYPDSILVAYHEGQEVLSHRPVKMMQEWEEIKAGNISPFEFNRKWKFYLGQQYLPDLSLPEKKIKQEEISPEDLVPNRASFVEISQKCAGV